jgi:hypothetical protein
VHVGCGERVAFGGRNPRVEDFVVGPDRDDNGLACAVGGLEDEFGEDAVRLAEFASLCDPGQVAVTFGLGDGDGA